MNFPYTFVALLLGSPLESCDHVRLDAARSDAAWRVVFAAHVFGRQEPVGRAAQPGRMLCVHTSTKRVSGTLWRQQARGDARARATSPCCAVYGRVNLMTGRLNRFFFFPPRRVFWRLDISNRTMAVAADERSQRSLLANTKWGILGAIASWFIQINLDIPVMLSYVGTVTGDRLLCSC